MRTVTSNAPYQPVRTVSGRLTITDTLPRFTHFLAQETPSTIVQTDCAVVSGKILRVGVDAGYLSYSVLDPALAGDTASAFYNAAWTRTTYTLKAGSRPGLSGSRVFFQTSDTIFRYMDWNGTGWGAPSSGSTTSAYPAALAAVSTTEFFMVEPVNFGSDLTTRYKVSLCDVNGFPLSVFPGYLYTDQPGTPIVGGAKIAGTVPVFYLYLTDRGGKRTQMVYCVGTYPNITWSEVSPVIPLDVVDDTSLFTLSGVSMLGGKTFITGVLKRKLGMNMHVYLQGPDNATTGRELFIDDQQTDIPGGKLVQVGNTVWYIGAALRSSSAATTYMGTDNPDLTVQVTPENTSLSASYNSPFSLNASLPPSIVHEALRSGAEVLLEAKVGNDYISLGRYSLDAVMSPQDGNGEELQLVARSSAMKRLNQWHSDASYDFWSQTKLNCNPKDLTQVLRVTSQWKERDAALSVETLNVDGLMYLSARACRGSLIRTRFKQIAGDFKARFGVGLNYYLENKTDAATRLGIDESQITESDYGSSGLFAVYGPVEYNGAPGMGLYWVNNNQWNLLANYSVTFTPGVNYWMMLQALEGHIVASYRADSTSTWTTAIAHDMAQALYQPWKTEQLGRGAIYMRPITPYSQGYAFLSDQDVIPVQDNGAFPTSDVVMVDEEQIHYNGKSPNVRVLDLAFRYGDQVAATAAPGATALTFAYDRTHARVVQPFTLAADQYLRAIKIWARKMGYPKDSLDVSVWAGPTDPSIPLGTQVESASIPSEKLLIDTSSWVVAQFSGHKIQSGNWVILSRGANPTHPESQTYYACDVSNAGNSPASYWDEQNDLWVSTPYSLPIQIYASDSEPGQWYSIYVAPNAGLSTASGTYVGQALAVTGGTGKGNCYKIVGYTYRAGQNAIFYVDRDPGMSMDETSVLAVMPTLKVSRTNNVLDRGYNGTVPVAHMASQVDVYRAAPYIESDTLQYYSSEIDYSLEEVAHVIARKAGILAVSGAELLGSTVTPSVGSPVVGSANIRGHVTLPPGMNSSIVFAVRMTDTSGDHLEFTYTSGSLQYAYKYANGTSSVRETFSLSGPTAQGDLFFSLYQDAVSFWLNGRMLYTFTLTAADAALTGNLFQITGGYANPLVVHFPEANIRVDNFILDAGRAGDQLLSDQIGDKRFFYQDDVNGALRLYMSHPPVNTQATPYHLSITNAEAETDGALATRIRLEGVEVAEKFDPALMRTYGNIYFQSNCREIYTTTDAAFYTGIMLDDFGSRVITRQFSGAADPRIEPGDTVWVSINGTAKLVLIDQVDFQLSQSQDSVLFDMNLTGRIPRSQMTL